jgi:hypothetical protein
MFYFILSFTDGMVLTFNLKHVNFIFVWIGLVIVNTVQCNPTVYLVIVVRIAVATLNDLFST